MSYQRDLEEYTDLELEAELRRREKLRNQGKCSYCGKSFEEGECRYHEQEVANIGGKVIAERVCW